MATQVSEDNSLTIEEIEELLEEAANSEGDWKKVNDIQIRLTKAMPGDYINVGSEKYRTTQLVNQIFADSYREGGTLWLVKILDRLINWE